VGVVIANGDQIVVIVTGIVWATPPVEKATGPAVSVWRAHLTSRPSPNRTWGFPSSGSPGFTGPLLQESITNRPREEVQADALEPGVRMHLTPAPPLSASLLAVMQREALADVAVDLGELPRRVSPTEVVAHSRTAGLSSCTRVRALATSAGRAGP
jgi:hypothetical protein